MNTKKYIYGRRPLPPNTFIGGVGGTLSTKNLLAAKLGIAPTRIKSFRIVNDEVQAHIIGDYSLPNTVFQNNSQITHYFDNDSLVKVIYFGAFWNTTNLAELKLEGTVTLGGNYSTGGQTTIENTKIRDLFFPEAKLVGTTRALRNNFQLENVIMPKLTRIGGTQQLNGCPSLKIVDWRSLKIIGHETIRTAENFINSGSVGTILKVHQDITNVEVDSGIDVNVMYAKNIRGWIIELYDDNGNYVSTL